MTNIKSYEDGEYWSRLEPGQASSGLVMLVVLFVVGDGNIYK